MTDVRTPRAAVTARPAGFAGDIATLGRRALRLAVRDPEAIVPALIVGLFFFTVNVGSFGDLSFGGGTFDVKAFQLPVAVIFTVTGLSRAQALVVDIQDGYLDRLLVTPVRRLPLLLGLMVADLVVISLLAVCVLGLGTVVGVRFDTGVAGMAMFVVMAGAWGLAFTGIPYAIALKTGNPAAVNSSFLFFFPFAFLAPVFVPLEAMTGWLRAVAEYNPVTYLLGGMRSLIITSPGESAGWDPTALAQGWAAIVGVGVVTMSMSLLALRGRTRRGA